MKIGDDLSHRVHSNPGSPPSTLCGPVGFLAHINDLQIFCNILNYNVKSMTAAYEVYTGDGHHSAQEKAVDQAKLLGRLGLE